MSILRFIVRRSHTLSGFRCAKEVPSVVSLVGIGATMFVLLVEKKLPRVESILEVLLIRLEVVLAKADGVFTGIS